MYMCMYVHVYMYETYTTLIHIYIHYIIHLYITQCIYNTIYKCMRVMIQVYGSATL